MSGRWVVTLTPHAPTDRVSYLTADGRANTERARALEVDDFQQACELATDATVRGRTFAHVVLVQGGVARA